MPEERPEISLIVPVYNEEDVLPRFREKPLEVLRGLGRSFEMVFVDDGSADGSPAILDAMKAEIPEVRVIRLDRNWGLTSALDAGFRHARGDILVSIDADLQNDPEDIPKLLDEIEDCDMVCGWRRDRNDPFVKRLSSKVANGWRNWRMGDSIHDTCSPLKAFRREFVRHLPPFDGMHRWLPVLAKMNGLRVREIPVKHHRRGTGSSKYGVWNRLWKGLSDLKAVKWMRRNRLRYEAREV
jgi:glycosyltransferase involved in cell wall biosynthesis